MIDYNNLPNTDNSVAIFYAAGSTTWQTWQKPKGCKFVYILVIGGGAGGGGGQSGSAVARTGGGGGGASGMNKGMFMANTIPDILYINVGSGGVGGAPNTNGSAGSISYVSVLPSTTAINLLLVSNSSNPSAGAAAGTIGSTGGAVGTANNILCNSGVFLFGAGQNGTSGGANTGGNGTALAPTSPVSGGAGGGGSSAANANGSGGPVNTGGVFPTLSGGAAGGTNRGTDGFTGSFPNKSNVLRNAFIFTGGSGGGANGAGIGGDGGNGSFGCGGGGGGAGTTGGRGGNGGDGLVIIISW